MATLPDQSLRRSEPVRSRSDQEAEGLSTRVQLAAATLLTGLSIAVPTLVIMFVLPLGAAAYRRYAYRSGPWWEPEVWSRYVFGGIAISIACALAGIALSTYRRATAAPDTERQAVNSSDGFRAWACFIMTFAALALIFAPLLSGTNASVGAVLVGLGLAGVGVTTWAVGLSAPARTRRWLKPMALAAFCVALLGNAYLYMLFALIGLSL